MLTINKNKVAEWMLLSYLSEQKYFQDKLMFFKKKYDTVFEKFEKEINDSSTEDFEKWDDYIEWKAYNNFYHEVTKTIENVRLGNFKVA
ncbi:MAG: hypothetical protein ABFS35_06235 [Bacteroidota bacterium]